MSDEQTTLELRGLEQLMKALKPTQAPVAKIGILGSSATRNSASNESLTNADIGAQHEFGTSSIPQRSFLRVPIADNLDQEMTKGGLFDQDTLSLVIKQASLKPWLQKVAICAEACVADAFATGGDGKWPAWKQQGYTNNSGQLLVDTGQLRDSITSEVD